MARHVFSPPCAQGMQLVSSGYNPVLMQKGMKAGSSKSASNRNYRCSPMISRHVQPYGFGKSQIQ